MPRRPRAAEREGGRAPSPAGRSPPHTSVLRGRCYTAAEQSPAKPRRCSADPGRGAHRRVEKAQGNRRLRSPAGGPAPSPAPGHRGVPGLQAPPAGLSAAPRALQRISGLSSLVISALAIARNSVGIFSSRSIFFHRLLLPKAPRRLPVPACTELAPCVWGWPASGKTGPRGAS